MVATQDGQTLVSVPNHVEMELCKEQEIVPILRHSLVEETVHLMESQLKTKFALRFHVQ